jgi:SAM-dependent methyltransferase
MSEASHTRQSRRFYETFQFPGNRPLDQDGLILLRRFTEAVERLTSPRKRPLRVLDAGCGTGNTSVSLARRFPHVAFFGVDQSRHSLAKARQLAARERVTNFQCRTANLMRALPWKGPFDVVLCLGVLHHTANMKKGLSQLRRMLAENGELFLWIYGCHGRYRHTLNRLFLRLLLGPRPSAKTALALAEEFVLQDGRALRDLLGEAPVLESQRRAFTESVWIADQFLNPHETLLDMEDLLALIEGCGLEIVHAVGMEREISGLLPSENLAKRFTALGPRDQLIARDLLLKPERYFVILRKKHARGNA